MTCPRGHGGTTSACINLQTWEESFGGETEFPPELFGENFFRESRRPHSLVFWDLETCGLSDEPIFLAGVIRAQGESLRLTRILARDPSGEPALLRRVAELLGPRAVWVTFNGRSFDAPRLRRRAALHRVVLPEPAEHRDLLLLVRRRFKMELPDCRLSTVEL